MLKSIADHLPPLLRDPLVALWRNYLGNPEINILKFISDPTRLALDIGANAGSYTGELHRKSKGCVAFEPVPELAELIAKDHKSVQVHAVALSDESGSTTLRIPISGGGENPQNASVEIGDITVARGASRDIQVSRRRLDDFNLPPVGLIKMDVEGHEEAVLIGGSALIERDMPAVLIEGDEHRHKPGCVAAISRYFLDRGYQGWFMMGRKVFPFSEFDLTTHQNKNDLDVDMNVIFNREYANLFIFVHDQERMETMQSISSRGVRL